MHSLPHTPLERLFQRLELAGFVISPADRLRVYRLLDGPAKAYLQAPARLRELLAPVLARSAAEQAKFYELFDQYFLELSAPLELDSVQQKRTSTLPNWWPYVLGIVLLLIGGYAVYSYLTDTRQEVPLELDIEGPPYASVGDTVTFFNRSIYSYDSSSIRWHWEYFDMVTGEVERVDSQQFHWTFIVPPTHGINWQKEVRLVAYPPGGDSIVPFQSQQLFTIFCASPPGVSRITGPTSTEINRREVFTLLNTNHILHLVPNQQGGKRPTGEAAKWIYQWDFGDGRVDSSGTYLAYHSYEQNGQYTVRLTVRDTSSSGICETMLTHDVRVGADLAYLPLATLKKDNLQPMASWGWLYYVLLSLIGILVVYYWVRYFAQRHMNDEEDSTESLASPKEQALKARFSLGDRAPYFIPLRNQNDQISINPEQLRLADALRLRQEGLRKEIDVSSTLQATIHKGGFPEVRYRYATKPSEYLFLIDEQSRTGHLGQLFKHLVSFLYEQDVYTETFHYRQHFTRFWNAYYPDGLSLEQLQSSYGDYRLVVLGDLHELIDPAAKGQPHLRVASANVIRNWSQRLLLTPVPPVSWSYREKLLARLFQPFPADADGLGAAAHYVENNDEHLADSAAYENWKDHLLQVRKDADTEHRNWRRWSDIKEYLSSYPEDLVRWFSALAVFPLAAWEMTIAIGRRLGIDVTYDNLLRLARIPTLQKDTFDERLRQALLKNLNPEDEYLAREVVRTELAAVKAVTVGAHIQRELETALAIQNFALDPKASENQDTIRFLLEHGIINKGQEAELDQVTTRYVNSSTAQTGKATKKRKRRTQKLNVRDYLARPQNETKNNVPDKEPKVASRHNLLMAIAATAAYLILLLIGWQLGGSEALYQLAFGEKPKDRPIQSAQEPLRNYQLVKEVVIIDSAVIYNNQAVDTYERVTLEETQDLLKQAESIRYLGYPLASANFSRLQYNRAVNLLNDYLRDSIDQETLADHYPLVQAQLATAESDSLVSNILHVQGVIGYYLGRPDSLLEFFYAKLDSMSYFDSLNYSPNLSTLLRRERSSIRELNIQVEDDQALNIQVDYYYNAERDGRDLQIIAYSKGQGPQPTPDTINTIVGPGSANLRLQPDRSTTGSTTNIIVELQRRGEIINSVDKAYTHRWIELVQAIEPSRKGGERKPLKPTQGKITPNEKEPEQFPFELRGSVIADSPRQRSGISGINIRLYPTNASNRVLATTKTDQYGDFTLQGNLGPATGQSYTLSATDSEDRYEPSEQVFTLDELRRFSPKELLRFSLRESYKPPSFYVEPEMVRIAGGTFTMGCITRRDGKCNDNELPTHEVTVSSFLLGKYEVTNAEFVAFLNAEGNQREGGAFWIDVANSAIETTKGDYNVSSEYERHPVTHVSWYGANAYAKWLSRQTGYNYRLPTEAEWEYAARGGERGLLERLRYAGSSEVRDVAWFYNNSQRGAQVVGRLRSNQLGLFDMSGNVYEWCSDSSYSYTDSAVSNPSYANGNTSKIIRGGAWDRFPASLRIASRSVSPASSNEVSIGFRLARD